MVLAAWLVVVMAASPQQPVDRAVEAYEQLEFERCVRLLSTETPTTARAALYRGLCRFNLAQPTEAREDFRRAMALDPAVRLPGGVSPKAVELFEAVRAEVPVAPEPVPSVTPEPPPVPRVDEVPPAAVETSSAIGTRAWVGPAAFAGASMVGASLGLFFGVQARQLESTANGAVFASLAEQQATLARQAAFGANVAWTSAAVALAAAVVWFALERF